MYGSPLTNDEIQTHIVWFVEEVVEAVNELHRNKIAHLDIRKENVCMNYTNNRVMFIDLDRWRAATLSADVVYDTYTVQQE